MGNARAEQLLIPLPDLGAPHDCGLIRWQQHGLLKVQRCQAVSVVVSEGFFEGWQQIRSLRLVLRRSCRECQRGSDQRGKETSHFSIPPWRDRVLSEIRVSIGVQATRASNARSNNRGTISPQMRIAARLRWTRRWTTFA